MVSHCIAYYPESCSGMVNFMFVFTNTIIMENISIWVVKDFKSYMRDMTNSRNP